MSGPNARSCYCKPGDTTCGTCERCGEPGHTRYFPGPVPVTGAWCDHCYGIVALRHRIMRLAPVVLIAGTAVLVARACGG